MHSRGGFEDFEVPGVQECSGTLLFVEVGRGIVTVDTGGARRNSREHSAVGAGSFIIRRDRRLWLTYRSAWGNGITRVVRYVLAAHTIRCGLAGRAQWLRGPNGVTAAIAVASVAMACLCGETAR